MISPATEKLLQFSSLPGLGTGGLRRLVVDVGRIGQALMSEPDRVAQRYARPNSSGGKQRPDMWREIIDDCHAMAISVISPLDEIYPSQLRNVEDFPPLLYVRGNSEALRLPGCAVVGTREASRLGLSWARQIAETVCRNNWSTVSGLALGIDTAAHEGALRAEGATVAVLAHGLDRITPTSNRTLAERILDTGGCLIAEHAPGVPPVRAEYVRRNRIQSGMSNCSVVVESAEEGGAIHQGRFTVKQGRPLFVVYPSRDTPGVEEFKFGGAQRLIDEVGAKPISSRQELEFALELSGQSLPRQEEDSGTLL